MIRMLVAMLVALLAACAAGCDPAPVPPLTKDELAKVVLLQNPFGNRVAFLDERGQQAYVMLHACHVYRSEMQAGVIVGWTRTLEKPFYPTGSSCTLDRTELAYRNGRLLAHICAQALGAGGGCAAGGTFESGDGIAWRPVDSHRTPR